MMKNYSTLNDSAGVFTLEEHLALLQSDIGLTAIGEHDENQPFFLRHKTNYEAEICMNILHVIAKCRDTELPIAKVINRQFSLPNHRFQVNFNMGWDTLHKQIQSAFVYEFSSSHFYSEEIKAWKSVREKFSAAELQTLAYQTLFQSSNDHELQKYVNLLNLFLRKLVEHIQSASYKKKIRDRNAHKQNNKSACVELFNHLVAKFAKVLVIRVDFSLKRNLKTIQKHISTMGVPHSHNDLISLKSFMTKFKNNWRHNHVLNGIEGYIFQYEYSYATGFHIHCYFFFDGSKHQEDISIAQYISNYWKKTTNQQGSTYICNMNKSHYKYCGIGMIHHSDTEKQSFLIRTFEYICKADQFFIFSEFKNFKRFQRSKLPAPKAKSGRTRILISEQSN